MTKENKTKDIEEIVEEFYETICDFIEYAKERYPDERVKHGMAKEIDEVCLYGSGVNWLRQTLLSQRKEDVELL